MQDQSFHHIPVSNKILHQTWVNVFSGYCSLAYSGAAGHLCSLDVVAFKIKLCATCHIFSLPAL